MGMRWAGAQWLWSTNHASKGENIARSHSLNLLPISVQIIYADLINLKIVINGQTPIKAEEY